MSLELIKEAVKVNRLIGQDSTQTVVENDIIVPDIKPDIASILLLDADMASIRAESEQDKILINGLINYKILYISDDDEKSVNGINTSSSFTYRLDVPDADSDMRCSAGCEVLHIDYSMVNSRKINAKAILSINGKVQSEVEFDVVNGITGLDGVQTLRKSIDVNCFIGETVEDCRVEESLEVPEGKPSISDILRNDVKITDKDYRVSDDKVIVKGNLSISTLYISDDETRSIQFMEHEVPFSQIIDIPGMSESSIGEVQMQISDSRFEPSEDSDGELRALNAEVILSLSASGFENRSVDVLVDAYAPNVRLSFENESVTTEEPALLSRSQAIVKDVMAGGEDSPEIQEVLNIYCSPALSEYQIFDDKVVIEGVLRNYMLYTAVDDQQQLLCYEQELPFSHSVDLKGITQDMRCEIGLDVEHCNYSVISANEIEVREVINVDVKTIGRSEVSIVVSADQSPMDDRKSAVQPNIIIYYTQQDDNLWKIAKKYLITVDSLQRWNDLEDNAVLSPGQQMLIFKTVV